MKTISPVQKKEKPVNNETLVFSFEGTLLLSTSLFPYFMLVAFEAGGILRSLILFLSYPLVWLLGEDQLGLNIMVFLCFFGIKKATFRAGSAVLPKFFIEDVGLEGFEAVMYSERKVAYSKLPRVMVECFLKDYLGVDAVKARELKSFSGFFMGVFEKNLPKEISSHEVVGDTKVGRNNSIGIIGDYSEFADQEEHYQQFKEDYSTFSYDDKRNWHVLPRERYLKPLIFHDGRLASRPTLAFCVALFIWLPFGLFLGLIRFTIGITLHLNVSAPILAFLGTRTTFSRPHNTLAHNEENNQKGTLYVCNHRTLLDPLYVAIVLGKPLSAVTYSLSKLTELVSPIRTLRLTRERERDRKIMEEMLSQGNFVVCPEGTTCREPYLLRFSPLFAELTGNIVPVAVDVKVSMFYGTTASGYKCLDPIFHFMNPNPTYSIKILGMLQQSQTCQGDGKSKIEVANLVQNEISNALGFACTNLTRKDKYLVLAGNEGVNPRNNCHP